MKNFVTIDCETVLVKKPFDINSILSIAMYGGEYHPNKNKIAQIGACIVENGAIKASYSWFVKPNENNEWEKAERNPNSITHEDTENADAFPCVWEKIKNIIGDLPIYAAHPKDAEHSYFQTEWTDYDMDNHSFPIIKDGLKKGESLSKSCLRKGISTMNMHDAKIDAELLAKVMLSEKDDFNINNKSEMIGKKICFHGIGKEMRQMLTKKCEENNISVVTTVSSKIDYLVINDNKKTAKVIKAEELGKEIITMDDFLAKIKAV